MSPKKKSTYRYSLLALLLVAFAAFGADLEKGKPEDVGLGKKTAELITHDQLQPGIDRGPFFIPGPGNGFGLLGGVRVEGPRAPGVLNPMDGSVGEYYWAGYAGTYFWVDPKEELVGVYMMQSVKNLLWYATMFKTLVVQSVVK
jgi:CubicO group peptidase (beta-lactamase class C family)